MRRIMIDKNGGPSPKAPMRSLERPPFGTELILNDPIARGQR
jgi:hypothetical protein